MAGIEFIAYYRVSTERQGRSGLGLDAQRVAVADYVTGRGAILSEFVEIESGKRNDRPQLAAAMAAAKKRRAVLVIAKLDRLARNVEFIAGLMNAGVEFIACDLPEANRLTLHMMAAVAEHEREVIAARTKAALAAAKARGTVLGFASHAVNIQAEVSAAGVAVVKGEADRHASNVLPIVREIERAGISTLRGIADALNARGVQTARGGQWYAATVRRLMQREGVTA